MTNDRVKGFLNKEVNVTGRKNWYFSAFFGIAAGLFFLINSAIPKSTEKEAIIETNNEDEAFQNISVGDSNDDKERSVARLKALKQQLIDSETLCAEIIG